MGASKESAAVGQWIIRNSQLTLAAIVPQHQMAGMNDFNQSIDGSPVQIFDCLQQLSQLQFLRYFTAKSNVKLMAVLLGKLEYCIIQFVKRLSAAVDNIYLKGYLWSNTINVLLKYHHGIRAHLFPGAQWEWRNGSGRASNCLVWD